MRGARNQQGSLVAVADDVAHRRRPEGTFADEARDDGQRPDLRRQVRTRERSWS
jgi:hypothetical protein